jgi:hypothetical protein
MLCSSRVCLSDLVATGLLQLVSAYACCIMVSVTCLFMG